MPDTPLSSEAGASWQALTGLCRDAWQAGLLRGFNGNASVRLPDDTMLITRSGCAKGRLREGDACVQAPDGALLHGAKVTVDSAPGKGTRIEMQFPKKNQ